MSTEPFVDGGTLYSVAFLTKKGVTLDRLVLVNDLLSKQNIMALVMKKFKNIEEITYVDEWQPVIVLEK